MTEIADIRRLFDEARADRRRKVANTAAGLIYVAILAGLFTYIAITVGIR